MRILLVDDNHSIRQAIRSFLQEQQGWEVCGEAAGGPEACEKARDLRPDLILLDNRMPGVSGFETARLIRQENSQVKILILSHQDERDMLPAALESGADGCVDKSRMASDLIPALKQCEIAMISRGDDTIPIGLPERQA
ncbi:MAG: response regulator transcription factor [Terriglobia bacterium]|jgi:two-component system nitrate/nitrite response regulator NarL